MTHPTTLCRTRPSAALRRLSVLIAVLLGGCETASPPAETAAPASTAAAAATTSSAAPDRPADAYWSSRFDAISTTSAAITGELQFTPTAGDALANLAFQLAGRYVTGSNSKALGLDAYSTAESATWSELLNVPMDGIVDIRKVAAETVAPGAPNGGLCGTLPTRWIAVVRRPESEGSDSLMIAAFSGEQTPSPQGDDGALCGTYSYAPH